MGDGSIYEERRRGAPHLRTMLALILILVCGGLGLRGQNDPLDRGEAHAAQPAAPAERAPTPADQAIRATLGRQSAALIGGDEQGWLRDVDPPLAGELRRLYANLRGLQISGWVTDPASVAGTQQTGPVWHTDTRIRVCFTGPTCTRTTPSTDSLTAKTTWRVTGDRAVLTRFLLDSGPSLPWEKDTLTFAAGDRVIVAAPSGGQRPARWLAPAEAAARVADRYTLANPRVGKYLVFLAGKQEWQTWFSGCTDRDVLGYALRPSETSAFIVIDATRVKINAHGENVLRHEMAHIATRYGPSTRVDKWATEGIAEYVAWAGHPISAYDRTDDARRLATTIGWTKKLDLPWSDGTPNRSGYYAMGFFAMRCLSETYGEPNMLAFFNQLAHGGRNPAQASEQSLHTPWPTAQNTCAQKINTWLRR